MKFAKICRSLQELKLKQKKVEASFMAMLRDVEY